MAYGGLCLGRAAPTSFSAGNGRRRFSDYEHELQMALMNRRLRPVEIETAFSDGGGCVLVHSFAPGEANRVAGRDDISGWSGLWLRLG